MANAIRPWSALVVGMALTLGCAPRIETATADAAQIRAAAVQSELEDAVLAYHDAGDLEALRSWVDTHTDHPELDTWREVVALREYESLVIGDPWAIDEPEEGDDVAVAALPEPTTAGLLALVDRYPGTLGAQTAQALLETHGLRRLSVPAFNDALVAFLEGRDDWVQDEHGRNLMPNVDLDAFRRRHESKLRTRLAQRLSEDACVQSMGYCTWYVNAYPQDPRVSDLQVAMKQEWYRRGHPRWRGSRFANCSYRCAKDCRTDAEPLDDACYAPCFAGCEAAAG